MSTRSRFFDSETGDRVYTSDAWAQVVAGLVGTGVAPIGQELAVTEDSPLGLSAVVSTGVAFILGYYFEVYSAAEEVTFAAADATNPRIDRVVVRRSLANREVTLAVLTGTPAASPSAPALTQDVAGTYEISLARVLVPALASSISNASITDERSSALDPGLVDALNTSTGHRHDGTDARKVLYSDLASIPSSFAPSAHTHTGAGQGGTIAYSALTGVPSTFAPSTHGHTGPSDGGTVAYSAITGKPSTFDPANHTLDPATGPHTGSLPWTSLSGVPGTFAPSSHALSSHTGTLAWASLSGVPSSFTPSTHAASHATGGSDPVSVADLDGWKRRSAGGTAGTQIYVGTSTPSSPAEGDIWVKG